MRCGSRHVRFVLRVGLGYDALWASTVGDMGSMK